MADRTSSSIDVDATPAEVMAVIADFAHYPEWVDSITAATVLSAGGGRADRVQMVLDHPVLKDTYTLHYDWDGDDEVSWQLVDGQLLKAMDGSYRLSAKGAGTTVVYTLAVELNLPMLGMIKRKAEKTIIDGALKGLKKRVEG